MTTDRMRLQRVGGGADIVTSLVTGQVIDVPLNVNLQIWAEVNLDEGDFVRLVVDWGNGNTDFFPCGACRVENKYTREGQYTVVAKIVDQNAPSGTAPLLTVTVTVTLNVFDFNPPPTPFICDAVGTDFDTPPSSRLPITVPGVTFSRGAGSFITTPNPVFASLTGLALFPNGPLTITFSQDKNHTQINFGTVALQLR